MSIQNPSLTPGGVMPTRSLITRSLTTAVLLTAAINSHAATLVQGEFQSIGGARLADTDENPGISVTPGSEGYSTGQDGLGTGGLDGSFNGAIADFAFYTSTGGFVESLGGAASLITTTTSGVSTSGDIADKIDIWTTTTPSIVANADPTKSPVTNPDQGTFARPSVAAGIVDISGLTDGSLYLFFGARIGSQDVFEVAFSLTGTGQTTLNLAKSDIVDTLALTEEFFVYRADFTDAAAYDTLTFSYDQTTSGGAAESRFAGVVLTAPAGIPEPGSLALLGLGGLLIARRRRG